MPKRIEEEMSYNLSKLMKEGKEEAFINITLLIKEIEGDKKDGKIDIDKISVKYPSEQRELRFDKFLTVFLHKLINFGLSKSFIEGGFLPFFNDLLESDLGLDINGQDENGATLLNAAIYNNIEPLIKILSNKGADLNLEDKSRAPNAVPISAGINEKSLKIANSLLDQDEGANGGEGVEKIDIPMKKDGLVFFIQVPLHSQTVLLYITELISKGCKTGILDETEMPDKFDVSKLSSLFSQKMSYSISLLGVVKKLIGKLKEKGEIDEEIGYAKKLSDKMLESLQGLKGAFLPLLDGDLVRELEGLISEVSKDYEEYHAQHTIQVRFVTDIIHDDESGVERAKKEVRKKIEERAKKRAKGEAEEESKENNEYSFLKTILEKLEDPSITVMSAWVIYDQLAKMAGGDSKNLAILDLLLPIIMLMTKNINEGVPFGKKPDDNGDPGGFGGGSSSELSSDEEGDTDGDLFLYFGEINNNTHPYE